MLGKLFGKKETKIIFGAPLSGRTVPLSEVPDPVFSQKMMGDGIAIIPTNGTVVSPVDATVNSVFPTNHAICLLTDSGLEIIIHIGLNTVNLKGIGFTPKVKAGDRVKAGDKLLSIDLNFLEQEGYPIITPIIVTNGDKVSAMEYIVNKEVSKNDPVLYVTVKD